MTQSAHDTARTPAEAGAEPVSGALAITAPTAIDVDVAIVGAGPAGLSLAAALGDAGLSVQLVERQDRAGLADPAPDGREIALTHRGADMLRRLGIWARFPESEIAPLRQAQVVNGHSAFALRFDPGGSGKSELGYLVSNNVIRKAAFEAALDRPRVSLIDGVAVSEVHTGEAGGTLRLADGRTVTARLVVAADSRFSETRRRMGIGADMLDFGRVVIVCRVAHTAVHDGTAHECFLYGGTLAILPLNGQCVSAVITVPADQAGALMAMPPAEFAALVRDRFGARLGDMTLVGQRHAYPLVAVYAHRFTARRFALLGDAAVGMHPVTAHGFNFGLYGVDALTRAIAAARRSGADIGSARVLDAYQSEHRRVTLPTYLGTNALVKLFTDDRAPARLLRGAVLRVADRLAPVKAGITRQLTGVLRAS